MLGERVFGQPRSRAERVRSRRSRSKGDFGKTGGEARKARRRKIKGRGANITSPARERVRFASIRAHPLFRFGTRWISLIALGLSIWTLLQIKTGSEFQIQSIEIEGAYYMSPSRIRSIAGIIGEQNFQADPTEIEHNLEAHPEILSAQISLSWPNVLGIEVEERLPVLEWNDAGRSWLISRDGVGYLRRSSPPELNRVHSLEKVLDIGDSLSPMIDPSVIQAAIELKAIIGDGRDLFFDKEHGLGFQDTYGWMAYFGSDGDMENKLQAYSKIVEVLLQNRYPANMVSVEELSAPYYR
jgi:hypothetical protein